MLGQIKPNEQKRKNDKSFTSETDSAPNTLINSTPIGGTSLKDVLGTAWKFAAPDTDQTKITIYSAPEESKAQLDRLFQDDKPKMTMNEMLKM